METSKRIPIRVDGTVYEVVWQDRHKTQRLSLYQNGTILGYKDFHFDVDKGRGVVEYAIRAIVGASPLLASLNVQNNGQSKPIRLNKRIKTIIMSFR